MANSETAGGTGESERGKAWTAESGSFGGQRSEGPPNGDTVIPRGISDTSKSALSIGDTGGEDSEGRRRSSEHYEGVAGYYASADEALADLACAVARRRAEIAPETEQNAAEFRFVTYVEGRAVLLRSLLDDLAAQGENLSSVVLWAALVEQAGGLSQEIRVVAKQSKAPLWEKAWRAAQRLAAAARRIARHFAKLITVAVYIPLGDGAMLTITVQPGPPGKPAATDGDGDGTQ